MKPPLKVTAWLDSPLAGDVPMLDAILECVMARIMPAVMATSGGPRHLVDTLRPRGQPVAEPGKIPIPIVRTDVGGLPIPHCSSGILSPVLRDGVEYFGKQLSVGDSDLLADNERKVVALTNGRYKSYRLPLRVRLVERVVWFVLARGRASGNGSSPASEIRKLLKRVTSIGKKASFGYGRVSRWEVEPAVDDYSWFAPSFEGPVLMRPLPIEALPDGAVGWKKWFGGCCPPYWQASFFRDVALPC